jgi:hypothetical protein
MGAAVVPYNYQWAAVAWFLQAQINPATSVQDTTVADSVQSPVPLYTLYRRQTMLVPDNNLVSLSTTPIGGIPTINYLWTPSVLGGVFGNFLEMSCLPDSKTPNIYFNSPNDITMPANRFASTTTPAVCNGWGGQPIYTPIPQSQWGLLTGSDIVLNDVVSFDIRVLPMLPVGTTPPPPGLDPFVTLTQPGSIFTGATFQYTAPPVVPGVTLPLPARVFDTWSSRTDGLNNYATWNTPGTSGTSIPFWSTTPQTYIYPVGNSSTVTATSRQMITPVTGSGPIILAIQVTIRIWDYKTNQTRQVTIVQAM